MINISEPPPAAFPIDIATSHYLVGQDPSGHWLAIEIHGLAGGIFVSRDAAMRYAVTETAHRPGAVDIATAPVPFTI